MLSQPLRREQNQQELPDASVNNPIAISQARLQLATKYIVNFIVHP